MVTPQAFQQMEDELRLARQQIGELAQAQENLKAQAQAAITASEQRSAALIGQVRAATQQGSNPQDKIELVDFKVNKPTEFHGRREESWKAWSRQFKVYCNVRKDGFKRALEWAEQQSATIDTHLIDHMGWEFARAADSRLYDFLFLQCKSDALVLIERYDGMGFEAWRQLNLRCSPSGGQFELDMMNRLMKPHKASNISD